MPETDRPNRSREPRGGPSRRAVLVGAGVIGAAAAGAVGGGVFVSTRDAASSRTTPTPTSVTVDQLLTERPFRVAHRGGSDNWPEMSAYAYREAVAHGYHALEISVARSADGVWFGLHDATLDRTSGTSGFVAAEHPWSAISRLRISAAATKRPDQPSQPYLTLRDFLTEFAAARPVFIDPKAVSPRFYPELVKEIRSVLLNPGHTVVAKSFGSNTAWARLARTAGLKSWGFYYAPQVKDGLLAKTASEWDLLGMDVGAPDSAWASARAVGRPLIAHVLHTPADDQRARAQGAVGEVVANVLAVKA